MRCEKCPLMVAQRVSYDGEYEYRCAVDAEYVDPDEGACKRTNKWILSQDIKVLNEKWEKIADKATEEYMAFVDDLLKNKSCG